MFLKKKKQESKPSVVYVVLRQTQGESCEGAFPTFKLVVGSPDVVAVCYSYEEAVKSIPQAHDIACMCDCEYGDLEANGAGSWFTKPLAPPSQKDFYKPDARVRYWIVTKIIHY